ncbi:MAG: GT4 family glycosyltransferase PelF [Planctomycetota bacterium]
MSDLPDVCLVLEGTYPYVPGGVSSWVHQLVTQMPELRFSVLHISPHRGFFDKHAYALPDNVVGLAETFLQRDERARPRHDLDRREATFVRAFCQFTECFATSDVHGIEPLAAALNVCGGTPPPSGASLLSQPFWRELVERYEEEAGSQSFQSFFWNWMFLHEPLIDTLRVPIPRARAYHTVSTGYAGYLAALAKLRFGAPMILTEHGIYTKERRIEIATAAWIPESREGRALLDVTAPYFKKMWNRHFAMLSRTCYAHADRIFTLYGGNKTEQIRDGADADKIEVVPNGIDVARFQATAERHRARGEDAPFTVGFVGRVCPIKDVRTFIAAMRLVADVVPTLRVRVLGPTQEDPEYAEDCKHLAGELGLGDNVAFEGKKNLAEELHDLDVLVLTSISEAQPLVVLEAGAVGVPVVSTDVGCCRELLEGRTAEDRALGPGGRLTPIASPGATARAVLELYADADMRRSMGESLKQRVVRFYSQSAMIETYRQIYTDMVRRGRAQGAA